MADPSNVASPTDFVGTLTAIFMALGAAAAWFVSRLGAKSGETSVSKSEEMVEIRSAIVDSAAVDRLTAAVEAHSMNIIEAKMAITSAGKDVNRIMDAFEMMTSEMRELGREIRELGREIGKKP